MNYAEAIQKSLTVRWKVDVCEAQGEKCWCRVIRCEEPLMYKEETSKHEEEYYVLGEGALGEKTVKHIVEIHNNSLK